MEKTVKILQFGEGNFLRCFIDWMVQKMNDKADFNGLVRIVQPIGDDFTPPSRILNERGGFYHTCLRGVADGKPVEIIEENHAVEKVLCAASQWNEVEASAKLPSVRFVVSNTTEAGIEYRKDQDTFPRKVALLLKARFGAGLPGLVFIPCELIEQNGDNLKKCVLQYVQDWNDSALKAWIENECVFCSTLVDRIVAGRPDPESAARYAEQLGERDDVLVCGEPFHFFVVETPVGFDLEAEFPLRKAGVNVVYTPDMQPYRTRKVRFLNGAHTERSPRGFSLVSSKSTSLSPIPISMRISARYSSRRSSPRWIFQRSRSESMRPACWSGLRIPLRTTSSCPSRSTVSRSGRFACCPRCSIMSR